MRFLDPQNVNPNVSLRVGQERVVFVGLAGRQDDQRPVAQISGCTMLPVTVRVWGKSTRLA
jgi:hypothetical protein